MGKNYGSPQTVNYITMKKGICRRHRDNYLKLIFVYGRLFDRVVTHTHTHTISLLVTTTTMRYTQY